MQAKKPAISPLAPPNSTPAPSSSTNDLEINDVIERARLDALLDLRYGHESDKELDDGEVKRPESPASDDVEL